MLNQQIRSAFLQPVQAIQPRAVAPPMQFAPVPGLPQAGPQTDGDQQRSGGLMDQFMSKGAQSDADVAATAGQSGGGKADIMKMIMQMFAGG